MRTIKPVAVLDYYDGIQIFEGRDPIGGHYIAMLIDSVGSAYRYLVTGANPERLRQFRVGEIDLLTLFLNAPGGEWFFIYADAPYGESLTLLPQEGRVADQKDLLPYEGYTIDDVPIDDLAEKLAIESNRTVLEFSLEPPETSYGHRVRVETLGEILTQTQVVVKHAYNSAIRDLKRARIPYNDVADGHLMDVVVPAAPGSFRVILEAAAPVDDPNRPLLPDSGELVKGLTRMDEVFRSAIELDKAQEILLDHKGYLAGAYIKLLRILAERNTGFNYSWADPLMPKTQYGGVSAAVAKELYGTLSESVELRTEEVEIEGEFVRVNLGPGTWGLRTDEGNKRGETREGGSHNLQGLIVGERYRFLCTAEVELDAMGQEDPKLYLDNIVPLSENPDDNPDAHTDVHPSML